MRQARLGAGLTHHFALSVSDEETLAAWQDLLRSGGIQVTDIRDRAYFRSIYFHDPDGHLVEIASATPGFMVDESEADLGQSLQLPPWLESRRDEIARQLRPLSVPNPIGRE
jgi:glyoxalase family protein